VLFIVQPVLARAPPVFCALSRGDGADQAGSARLAGFGDLPGVCRPIALYRQVAGKSIKSILPERSLRFVASRKEVIGETFPLIVDVNHTNTTYAAPDDLQGKQCSQRDNFQLGLA
jgi:hypothetical protein